MWLKAPVPASTGGSGGRADGRVTSSPAMAPASSRRSSSPPQGVVMMNWIWVGPSSLSKMMMLKVLAGSSVAAGRPTRSGPTCGSRMASKSALAMRPLATATSTILSAVTGSGGFEAVTGEESGARTNHKVARRLKRERLGMDFSVIMACQSPTGGQGRCRAIGIGTPSKAACGPWHHM